MPQPWKRNSTLKFLFLIAGLAGSMTLAGCAMFNAWKNIPPPGGCDQCHTMEISTNWKISYQAANVADERGRQYFQTPEYNATQQDKLQLPLETKMLDGQACFECHKAPSEAHRKFKGRFHH